MGATITVIGSGWISLDNSLEGLREYSLTIPSGKYEGKMWKANRGGTWYLYWYDHDDNPEMIKIERREILLLN